MSDDAEWIDICLECNTVRPARPRPLTTTRRPFWATAPAVTDRPRPFTAWPPRYPDTSPSTGHEEEERSLPQPLQPSYKNAAIYGSLGAVLLILLFGLLTYLLILRRKLKKVQSNRRLQDYSIRVEDVAHLSSPIDDSSQLYVNTSDLHKLVSSVRANRKHPSPPPVCDFGGGRAKCPVPGETINNVTESSTPISTSDALKRISGRLSVLGFNLQNSWNISKKKTGPELNAGYNSSVPDVVKVGIPEILDDDDLWSEDSFDSCSVGYENEIIVAQPLDKRSSTRESTYSKSKGSIKRKKIVPPCMPPPPPPTSKPSALSTDTKNFSGAREETERSFVAVRKAPAVTQPLQNVDECLPVYGNIEPSISHTAIQVPQVKSPTLPQSEKCYDSPKPQHGSKNYKYKLPAASKNYDSPKPKSPITSQSIKNPIFPPDPPSRQQNFPTAQSTSITLPAQKIPSNDSTSKERRKPKIPTHDTKVHSKDISSTNINKPLPPTAPKPRNKLNPLPKLKINLVTPEGPSSSEVTIDTTTTVISGTPSQDCHLFESKRPFPPLSSEKPKGNRIDSIDPSSLSVSARRALIEGKVVSSSSSSS
ncbi:hypothetical protein FHG87_013146 [Trinorchestia longiramus]|nr:hypothetical protein FHG87_013146 [Trinorchestia longiramus]